jgi:hypothetical protein
MGVPRGTLWGFYIFKAMLGSGVSTYQEETSALSVPLPLFGGRGEVRRR